MVPIDYKIVSGKKVLIRVDFNVPLDENLNITDLTRIQSSLPTIKNVVDNNGKVIIISHLGRPKNTEKKFSLSNIVKELSRLLDKDVIFLDNCIGDDIVKKCEEAPLGSVILLENLRFHKGEAENSTEFAKNLAKLGDIFINDAFGVCHRINASTYELPKLFPNKKYAGELLTKEVIVINKILRDNTPPVTAVIGGSKVSTKLPIIDNLIKSVDNIIIGGAMMYTFAKAMGGDVGKSLIEDDFLNISMDILNRAEKENVSIYLPTDTIVAKEFSNDSPKKNVPISKIPDDYIGLDIGEETIKIFSNIIENSKTILWNGPMGVFEMPSFANGTIAVGEAIIKATEKGAFSLVGGGDSVSATKLFKMDKKMSYISTGGGAMLESLEGKTLPGIEVMYN